MFVYVECLCALLQEVKVYIGIEICRFPCYALLRHRRRNRTGIRLGGTGGLLCLVCAEQRKNPRDKSGNR